MGFYLQAFTNGTRGHHFNIDVGLRHYCLERTLILRTCLVLSVVFSESARDSAQGELASALILARMVKLFTIGAWSGSIITAALIIPALIQKYTGNITLHDAVLVLKYVSHGLQSCPSLNEAWMFIALQHYHVFLLWL